jgi:hypothetical protein
MENRVPTTNDVVPIRLGYEVVYDTSSDVALATMGGKGSLRLWTGINTRLKVGTLLVMPSEKLGIWIPTTPVTLQVTTEIIIAKHPLYTPTADPNTDIIDPQQCGTALLVLGESESSPTYTPIAEQRRSIDVGQEHPGSGGMSREAMLTLPLPISRGLIVSHSSP